MFGCGRCYIQVDVSEFTEEEPTESGNPSCRGGAEGKKTGQ